MYTTKLSHDSADNCNRKLHKNQDFVFFNDMMLYNFVSFTLFKHFDGFSYFILHTCRTKMAEAQPWQLALVSLKLKLKPVCANNIYSLHYRSLPCLT